MRTGHVILGAFDRNLLIVFDISAKLDFASRPAADRFELDVL